MSRKNAYWDVGYVRVISTADAVCGSYTSQHRFQLFLTQMYAPPRTFLVSLESSEGHSLLIAVIPPNPWLALNALKSLSVPTAWSPED